MIPLPIASERQAAIGRIKSRVMNRPCPRLVSATHCPALPCSGLCWTSRDYEWWRSPPTPTGTATAPPTVQATGQNPPSCLKSLQKSQELQTWNMPPGCLFQLYPRPKPQGRAPQVAWFMILSDSKDITRFNKTRHPKKYKAKMRKLKFIYVFPR